jgi:hypothetical protein
MNGQLDRSQRQEAIALIESIAWGDMDMNLRTIEEALERAVAATANSSSNGSEKLTPLAWTMSSRCQTTRSPR